LKKTFEWRRCAARGGNLSAVSRGDGRREARVLRSDTHEQGADRGRAVKRIDALFAIERETNGLAAERIRVRHERSSRPLVIELEGWLRGSGRQSLQTQRLQGPRLQLQALERAHSVPQRRAPMFVEQRRRARASCCGRGAPEPAPMTAAIYTLPVGFHRYLQCLFVRRSA
jgi:hypothetical protein